MNVQNKKKSWYVIIVSPSFLSSGRLFEPSAKYKRGKAAFGSMVSHEWSIAHISFSDNAYIIWVSPFFRFSSSTIRYFKVFKQGYLLWWDFRCQEAADTGTAHGKNSFQGISNGIGTEPLPAKAGRFGLLLKRPKVVPLLLYFYPISKLSDLLLSCKHQAYTVCGCRSRHHHFCVDAFNRGRLQLEAVGGLAAHVKAFQAPE